MEYLIICKLKASRINLVLRKGSLFCSVHSVVCQVYILAMSKKEKKSCSLILEKGSSNSLKAVI